MKKINVEFKLEPERADIGVLFSASEKDEEVAALMEKVSDPLSDTLTAVDENNSAVTLKEDSIITISSDNKRIRILADDGTYTMRVTLKDIEQKLHPRNFLRISRYEIINLKKVEKFDFSVSGSLRIDLKNGTEIWASRRYISSIRNRLKGEE